MVEKDRMNGLTHGVISPKGEGDVRYAAGYECMWEGFLYGPCCLNKIYGIAVMLFYSGGNGKDIGIENYILGGKADFPGKYIIRAGAYLNLPLIAVGLTTFIEGHNDGGRAIALEQLCIASKLCLAFLKGDGIDYPLALNALEASLQYLPLGGVYHDGNLAYLRL